MPKVNRFKNPLKLANGHASSSTTPATQALPDASTIPLQAHEVSIKNKLQFSCKKNKLQFNCTKRLHNIRGWWSSCRICYSDFPQPEPADVENDPVSPVDIRGSSTDNNTNLQSTA
ncbi:hypothetical protein R3W88_001217 [Solanum pinnatisectum]|uniref:Uncharacterized protein n=1 Tax=Solanum pinnatisectum TaxID=50273 RepID=A0AAV9MKG4_9SOLN|nr:hypothetical protein R3W88_001217 [Solanum pinnatisectum]